MVGSKQLIVNNDWKFGNEPIENGSMGSIPLEGNVIKFPAISIHMVWIDFDLPREGEARPTHHTFAKVLNFGKVPSFETQHLQFITQHSWINSFSNHCIN
jgi:hypothetical protein